MSQAKPFKRTVALGYLNDSYAGRQPVYANFGYKVDDDGKGRLSITGVVGPRRNGNCTGSCGQIDGTLLSEDFDPLEGVDAAKLAEVWDRWHLNDLNAGTRKQMDYLRGRDLGSSADWYTDACAVLKEADLLVDDGYRFGSAWLWEPVPDDVLEWLQSDEAGLDVEGDSVAACWLS